MNVTLPLLILLFSAVFCLLFWAYPKVQALIALGGTVFFLWAAIQLFIVVRYDGIQVSQAGNWPAPFGITMVADLLGALMVAITAIIAFLTLLYAFKNIDKRRKSKGFYPIFLFMVFGVTGSFLAGDVFNLYVWYEVMLVASFVLISLGSSQAQLEGSVKYVVLNFIASGFFLAGIGLLYKATGTLNMADLALRIREMEESGLIMLSAIFFFMSFGIKAAVFPLFSWLPASYHTPPVAVSALVAALLTKVGVYTFIRFFTLILVQNTEFTHTLLMIAAGFTMVTGVFGAMAQNEIRKLLSFHIISQIGYMIMGLAIFTPLAIAGAVFFIIHNIVVKTNLFLISGIVKATNGHFLIKKLGGVYDRYPLIALLFVVSAFSLAGIPPLTGFWGKFVLAKAGLEAGKVAIVAISLAVGILTLFSMVKIWMQVFWARDPDEAEIKEGKISRRMSQGELLRTQFLLVFPSVVLAVLALFLGLYPDFLLSVSMDIANDLLNPGTYINAVLKNRI